MARVGKDTSVYRFGVSMEPPLVRELDGYVERSGFRNRSEAIREIIRDHILRHRWDDLSGEVAAVVSVFYNRAVPGVEERIAALRKRYSGEVLSGLETPLKFGGTVLVMSVCGERRTVCSMVERLQALEGVAHAEAVMMPKAALGMAPGEDERLTVKEYFERPESLVEPPAEEMAALRSRLQTFSLSGAVALDAGCGSGVSTALLLDMVAPGGRVIAVDFSKHAVERTRERVGAKVELRLGDLTSLNVRPCSVDFVLCHDTFGFISDQAAFLRSMRLVLKPGGRLFSFERTAAEGPFARDLPAHSHLERLICSAGMILDEFERSSFYAFTAFAPGGSRGARRKYGNDTRKEE